MRGRKLGHPGGYACRDARAATWDGHIPNVVADRGAHREAVAFSASSPRLRFRGRPHPNDELTPFLTPPCPLQAPLRRPPYKSMRFSLARSQRRASWKLLCSPATARARSSPRGSNVGFMTCQTSQTTSAEEFEKPMVLDSQVCLPPRTIVESTLRLVIYTTLFLSNYY